MRYRLAVVVFAAVLLAVPAATAWTQNPITGGVGSPPAIGAPASSPGVIARWSRSLQSAIAALSRRVAGGEWSAGLTAFALAVLFGIVHIAGPGHGKVFAVSYFSGRAARPRDGILYSAVVNAVDSISAFALVMIGYVALRAVLPQFRTEGPRILQLVSYGAIVAFALAHLVGHLRARHAHAHAHDEHGEDGDGGRGRSPWVLALSVGLIPCPVSTILLVYGVANGVLPLMVLMVIGVSTGGFVTMSVISLAVITGRAKLLGALGGRAAAKAGAVLEYLASGAMIALGVILFLSVM